MSGSGQHQEEKLKRLRKKRQNILDGAEILEEVSFGELSKKGCLGNSFPDIGKR